ncbi:hypothetical protein ACJJTC_017916 [Scirpophaga incertulas]
MPQIGYKREHAWARAGGGDGGHYFQRGRARAEIRLGYFTQATQPQVPRTSAVQYPHCRVRERRKQDALTSRAGCSHGGATRTADALEARAAPARLFSVPKSKIPSHLIRDGYCGHPSRSHTLIAARFAS